MVVHTIQLTGIMGYNNCGPKFNHVASRVVFLVERVGIFRSFICPCVKLHYIYIIYFRTQPSWQTEAFKSCSILDAGALFLWCLSQWQGTDRWLTLSWRLIQVTWILESCMTLLRKAFPTKSWYYRENVVTLIPNEVMKASRGATRASSTLAFVQYVR